MPSTPTCGPGAARTAAQARLFLRLAVVLGARRGELISLRWPDIDLDRGEVLIAGNVVRVPDRPWSTRTPRPTPSAGSPWAPARSSSAAAPSTGAEVLTKRAQAERAYAQLSATGAPVSAGQLAAAAGLSASYARALVAQFQAWPPATFEQNGRRPAAVATDADSEATS